MANVHPQGDDGWSQARPVRAGASNSEAAYAAQTAAPLAAGWGSPSGTQILPPVAPQTVVPLGAPPRAEERAYLEKSRKQRGLPAWGALLVLIVIAGIGGIIDLISGSDVKGGFNYGIIIASVVAILIVRRHSMFPVVIAPPIVYSLATGVTLYFRSNGGTNRAALWDSAQNWLVYGFPAIAAATAAVLIIAGIRLITHR